LTPLAVAASAPQWVTYVTLAIACVGLLTGLGSLAVSYVNYRASGHRVTISGPGLLVGPSSLQDHWSGGAVVRNEGRGPVNVDELLVRAIGTNSGCPLQGVFSGLPISSRITNGEHLSVRLEGSQSAQWTLNMSMVLTDITGFLEMSEPTDRPFLQLGVLLGDGRRVFARQKFYPDRYSFDFDRSDPPKPTYELPPEEVDE
jgi:hypothetical protein